MAWHARRTMGAVVAASDAPAGARRVGRPPAFLAFDFESVLPAQWFRDERAALQPAKRLMLAVLTDAIELVLQDPAPVSARRAYFQRRAADWLRSTDRRWFFSFVNVCETLGLDAKRVRAGITRLVEEREARGATTPHSPGMRSRIRREKSGSSSAATARSFTRERRRSSSNGRLVSSRPSS